MPLKPSIADDPAALRRRAVQRLRHKQAKPSLGHTEAGGQRRLHELEVHQVELEMQKEELEAARDAMELLLEKYRDLYDFAPVGYLTLDDKGGFREANLTGASLLGVARSALAKQRFGAFLLPADRAVFDAFLTRVFAGRAREVCDVRLLVKDRPPVDVGMEAIALESGLTCRVALTDITDRKQADADRMVMNKLESVGILAGGIAHDFNNLLTVILLNLELARRLAPAGGDLERHIEEAKQTSLLARGLTAQLVTFADGGAPVRKAMPLAGLIQDSVRPALSGSNVRCEYTVAENLRATEVDAGQIGQVIRNLVLNAREAMPQGGVIFVRAENVMLHGKDPVALPAGPYVRVSITDQGSGIARDVLPKIFDPYFSTKNRGQQRGMGLGLTICHSIVQKHDGAIIAQSELGIGTTFHIYLPAACSPGDRDQALLLPAIPWHGRVLVMDDEEPVRKLVGMTLGRMGHAVELAEDGQTAIAMYKNAMSRGRPIDVVILDLTIRGGMGGQDAVRALLKLDPAVRAIAMSGYVQDPVIMEPERFGFAGALAKPFDYDTMQTTLSRVMGRAPVGKGSPCMS